ncbi:molybdate ABC transporter substrate-binding protein [Virgibacillus flavescens]|uniref:molybdate ABC transporter substrate-binding protein n=1 Tax=Virgibacillus flavescens TaxID=1611422 RepID=UPI003D32A927
MFKNLLCMFLILITLIACSDTKTSNADKQEIFVSAAASLTGALDEISGSFEKSHPDIHITYNLGGSGKLAQQIQQGAPVDVFLSADQHWMDVLEKDQLILPNTKIDFAKNSLVLITNETNDTNIDSLTDLNADKVGQIGIGNPESVPAGSYAKEALTKLKLWESLTPHLVYAKDVRQVLTYVESNNVEIGFVYGSDLKRAEKVKVLKKVDTELLSPIVYPAAIVKTSENQDAAKTFLEFLQSDKAKAIFDNYGFDY